jgi:ferredoxin
MLLTLGIKNLFGCIVGLKKTEWHMRSGVNRKMFARLLVQICQAVKPTVTLVDGILAMEGQGPGKRGKPRYLGVLVGSSDTPAADWAICRMLGIDPDSLPTLKAARELGLLNGSIRISGDIIRIDHFELPVLGPLTFGPRLFRKFLRKHLVQRPVVDQNDCQFCGECWQYCPAKAITPYANIIGFDYDRCIRCYCCVEICPHGALEAKETLPGKVIRKISRLNN